MINRSISNLEGLSIFVNPAGFNHEKKEWLVPEIQGGRGYSELCHLMIQEEGSPDFHIFAYGSVTSAAFVAVRGCSCAVLKTRLFPLTPDGCMRVARRIEAAIIAHASETCRTGVDGSPAAEPFIRLS